MPSIGEYHIRIKPDTLAKETEKDLDRIIGAYKLDKAAVYGDGEDLTMAKGMPLDTFKMLSGGDPKITRDDLLRFANTEQTLLKRFLAQIRGVFLPSVMEKVFPKQQELEKPDPKTTRETIYEATSYLNPSLSMSEHDLTLKSDRTVPVQATITETKNGQKHQETDPVDSESYVKDISRRPEVTLNKVVPRQLDRVLNSDPTVSTVFRYVGGEDENSDGQLQLPRELSSSKLVQTTDDAVELGGIGGVADPNRAMLFLLKKNGIDTSMIDIDYNPKPPVPPTP